MNGVYTALNLAVMERPDSWPWLALIMAILLVIGAGLYVASTWSENGYDDSVWCMMPLTKMRGVKTRCDRRDGHAGPHLHVATGLEWTTQQVSCFDCGLGLYRWLLPHVAACERCQHVITIDQLSLIGDERLVDHKGWLTIVTPIPSSVD